MKSLIAALGLAAGLTFATANPASAGIPYGTSSDLTFVAEMKPLNAGQTPMAICHYTSMDHVAFMGYWITNKGYVMSSTGCEGNSYSRFREGQFAQLQAAGFIPADLPAEPALDWKQIGRGYFWIFLAVMGGLIKLVEVARHGTGSIGLKRSGDRDILGQRALLAMCMIARADGRIDNEETRAIAFAYEKIMGTKLTDMQIRTALSNTPAVVNKEQLEALGAGLNDASRQTVMRGALLVACSDGEIQEPEHRLIALLADALIIPAPQIRTMVHDFKDLLRPQASAAPA